MGILGSNDWKGSAVAQEPRLHQIAPYIGRLKSPLARVLVSSFTKAGQTVFDPFSGAGTVPLEAWIHERNAIASDLNPYAQVLTTAKLFPPRSLEEALGQIEETARDATRAARRVDLRKVPSWVRVFFHSETLRETLAWSQVLTERRSTFLLACLLGILHHQRPGFLSHPSSHTVPYLRACLKRRPSH